ncbi:hypothetical protein JRQ81_016479 [Phrynocephalus forsythii]|uniref:RING-type domain-containing protein n=1 Tax=Phrynocephalus forsythii TaxID=171643 RepID=A0A9Q1B1I0_9SAUR|nr:hypothetical protein JRQ81_016479 [Phrynocephalus forsythii]
MEKALEAYSAALRLGPPPAAPSRRRLGTLVDCLVLRYRLRQRGQRVEAAAAGGDGPGQEEEEEEEEDVDDDNDPKGTLAGGREGKKKKKKKKKEEEDPPAGLWLCSGCRGFLGEPVTPPCGHTHCRRCLREGLRARCRRCGETLGGGAAAATASAASSSVTVVLSHLAEKWFPAECERARTWRRLADLLGQGRLREAQEAASRALAEDPCDLMLRIYRAESFAGLQEFKLALDDLNAVTSKMPNWPEAYYRRAKILHNAGSVDDALQLFLHCLAIDESFLPAKLEVEKMLCDLLSPENVRESLKESGLSSSHVRSKPFIHGSELEREESSGNLQLASESDLETSQVASAPLGGSLHRAQSAHSLNSAEKFAKDDGLKRVSSEPLLSSQEKGALLKRKLSLSEQDTTVSEDGRNKHKKQGETTKRDAMFSFSYGTIPEELVDASDFECSLCMR